MGAEVRVDVIRYKLANPRSVLRPVGVVAHSPLTCSAASYGIDMLYSSTFLLLEIGTNRESKHEIRKESIF